MNIEMLSKLSPFEIKNELIKIAKAQHQKMMLNAGRGNPNFLATEPRHAFIRIGEFALEESQRSYSFLHAGFGGMPEKEGIVNRYDYFNKQNENKDGMLLLNSAIAYVNDHLGIPKEDFIYDIVGAYLGCNYPVPPRMLENLEEVVKIYIAKELCQNMTKSHQFDIFATEGGTAAMTYLFHSLTVNTLIKKEDKIAIITPIFSPYLEIPLIPEYQLEPIYIKADEDENWQIPEKEINKLKDKQIKLLCMVNPSNPPSVKLDKNSLDQLTALVNHERSDLMIVTDDVYATFADDFISVFETCPENTLVVYSFSKYFGATGWRLGVMGLHHHNVFDKKIAALSDKEKEQLYKRYESLTTEVEDLKFIDRLVADSRTVALNHTAGISTPQQLQMTLFALSSLLDESDHYRVAAKSLIQRRFDILYQAIGAMPEPDPNRVDYYTVIDLEELAKQLYNKSFANWVLDNLSGLEFLLRLAKETSVVLLPGKGFEVDHPSVRVSLANLMEFNYKAIGHAVSKLLEELYQQFDSLK